MPPRPALNAVRRYATVAADAVASTSASTPAPPSIARERVFGGRKAFLYSYYTHLLRQSDVVLLFQHANLSVVESRALRAAIAAIPLPPSPEPLSEAEAEAQAARLTILRTGVLSSVVRAVQPPNAQLTPHLDGQTALITVPSLSPAYISKILAATERVMKRAQKDEKAKDATKEVKQPAFTLTAAVLEGNRLMDPATVREVAKLPELDTLRAQLVGLLESPGRQLVGVLSQAGGGALVRTLQGLEQGLKDKAEKAE